MATTVQLSDPLDQRAREEAARTFNGDLSALVNKAVSYFLDTQDALRQIAFQAEAVRAASADPITIIENNPNLLRHINQVLHSQKQSPLNLKAVKSGKTALQPSVIQMVKQLVVASSFSAAAGKPAKAGTAIAPTISRIPAMAPSPTQLFPGILDPQTEDSVAQIIASSDEQSADVAAVAESATRISAKVAEIRAGRAN